MKILKLLSLSLLFLWSIAWSQHGGDSVGLMPTDEDAGNVVRKPGYSPYAGRNFPTRVYFGDTHLHTSTSFDAGSFGNRLDARAAYRFAKGEQVTSSSGLPAKLSRPLDWIVITDHSDMMGIANDIQKGTPSAKAIQNACRVCDAASDFISAPSSCATLGCTTIRVPSTNISMDDHTAPPMPSAASAISTWLWVGLCAPTGEFGPGRTDVSVVVGDRAPVQLREDAEAPDDGEREHEHPGERDGVHEVRALQPEERDRGQSAPRDRRQHDQGDALDRGEEHPAGHIIHLAGQSSGRVSLDQPVEPYVHSLDIARAQIAQHLVDPGLVRLGAVFGELQRHEPIGVGQRRVAAALIALS